MGLPDFLFSQSCKDTWLIPPPLSSLWLESCSVHHIQLHTQKCCGTLSYPSLIYPIELTTFYSYFGSLFMWFIDSPIQCELHDGGNFCPFFSLLCPQRLRLCMAHGGAQDPFRKWMNEWMSGHLSEWVYLWMSHYVCDARLCLSMYERVEVCICGCISMSTSAFVCVHLWFIWPGLRTCVSVGTSVCVSMCLSCWSGRGEGLWCCILHPTIYPSIWMRSKKTWPLWAPSHLPPSQPVPNRWQINPTVGHTVTFRGSSRPPFCRVPIQWVVKGKPYWGDSQARGTSEKSCQVPILQPEWAEVMERRTEVRLQAGLPHPMNVR